MAARTWVQQQKAHGELDGRNFEGRLFDIPQSPQVSLGSTPKTEEESREARSE